jgi:outer membrane protein assembly factor BamB
MRPSRSPFLLGALILIAAAGRSPADDWPGWLGPRADSVWRESGLLDKFPKGGPKVLWRQPVGGGYSGPAVADGKVYVTDRVLDPGQKDPANPFARTNSAGKERVLCLDAKDGNILWKHEYPCKYTMSYPCGPRAMPVVSGGKVYSFGAMGNLYCLDANTGKVAWSKDFRKDYDAEVQTWGFSSTPLVEGNQLICLVGKKPAVVAFDKETGKENWRALEIVNGEIGYCPPMIGTFGGRRQLVVWHPESVNGLDLATGKTLWSYDWLVRANMTIATPRQVGDRLFLTGFYCGCRMLQIDGKGDDFTVKEVWRGNGRGEMPDQTDKLHAVMCTPFVKGEHIYGVCSYGQLRCLRLEDGKRVWSDLKATGDGSTPERWGNAFLVAQGDRFILFNEKGDLILAKLTPKGYDEIDRARILEQTGQLTGNTKYGPARKIVWTHPAFANKTVYVRNDKEIVAVSLAAGGP